MILPYRYSYLGLFGPQFPELPPIPVHLEKPSPATLPTSGDHAVLTRP